MIKAPVNKIIPSSIVDGPGNRTAIFFQSCNFNCRYCHNPETIQLCKNCALCVKGCPTKALTLEDGIVNWNEKVCCSCDQCIKNCPHNASPRVKYMNVDQIISVVENNMPFIRGITVSGGECSLQMPFVIELFKRVKELGITTLLDSNGSFDFEKNPEILEYCDGVMLDIKATDPSKHLWLTGCDNRIVLENAKYLAEENKLTEIRTVIIPDALNNEETIMKAGEILNSYLEDQNITYKLIKYRHFGVRKEYRDFQEPNDDYMCQLKEIAQKVGFKSVIII